MARLSTVAILRASPVGSQAPEVSAHARADKAQGRGTALRPRTGEANGNVTEPSFNQTSGRGDISDPDKQASEADLGKTRCQNKSIPVSIVP